MTHEHRVVIEHRVTVEQDEAGYYVVSCPALLGCHSQGKTEEEALANIREAIEGWLEAEEAKAERRLPLEQQTAQVFPV